MKEQPLFAPGDRVCCVDSKGTVPQIIEGKEYTIDSVYRTPCCGVIAVSLVGVVANIFFAGYLCSCGNEVYGKFPCYYHQTRFVPVDFDRYAEETFHQSLKGKPVNALNK